MFHKIRPLAVISLMVCLLAGCGSVEPSTPPTDEIRQYETEANVVSEDVTQSDEPLIVIEDSEVTAPVTTESSQTVSTSVSESQTMDLSPLTSTTTKKPEGNASTITLAPDGAQTTTQSTAQNITDLTTQQGQKNAQPVGNEVDPNSFNNYSTDTQSAAVSPAPETAAQTQSPATGVSATGATIEQKDGVTYVGGILIANKTYGLPENYGSGLDADALQAFNEMQAGAWNDGINLFIVSGYRSYWTQDQLYRSYTWSYGQEETDRFSARAGHSEHQTGLAMDLNSANRSFVGTPEARWIAAHCAEYGFIIRYPDGKENITGFMYEPWHVRYVGKDLARSITDSGLCLEEYLGISSVY